MSSANLVVLSFHEVLLHKSDVDLISGPYWLNDTVISFYFEFLEKVMFKNEKDLLFISPEVTQCLKMVSASEVGEFLNPLQAASKRFLFFALNDNESSDAGGSHWSLLVYSRPERQFFHFDSLKDANDDQAWRLATHLLCFLAGKSNGACDFTSVDTLLQNNGYDCGIHVLCNVDMIVAHVLKNDRIEGCGIIDYTSIKNKRRELLEIIDELASQS